ncbi:MAG: hypothetical protein R6V01_07195 [Thermoplasmatota archaeon]
MKKRPVMDTGYQKVIIYPSEIGEKKMKKLFDLLSREHIPISYEQY